MSNSMSAPEAKRVCNDCGLENYPTSFTEKCREKQLMNELGVCFSCAFWRVQIEKKHDTVIDGFIYSVGDVRKPPNQRMAGMAGRRFDIEYFDGRAVTTHDLWAGSEVPERYRHLIPDTARFAGGATRAKVGETTCWNPSSIAKAGGAT